MATNTHRSARYLQITPEDQLTFDADRATSQNVETRQLVLKNVAPENTNVAFKIKTTA